MPRPRLPRPSDVPAYAWNGAAVAAGIGIVQLAFGLGFGPAVAALATSGAVCTSLADTPTVPGRVAQRVLAAAACTVLAAAVVAWLRGHPLALGVAMAALAFGAMMTMSWGARAGAVSFAPLLSAVFTMAVPETSPLGVREVSWVAAGACAQLGWSLATSAVLQPLYRRLSLAAALAATARLFRSRAQLLLAPGSGGTELPCLRAWIADEAALAERLQSARDLVFAAQDSAAHRRDAATLLHAIEMRDLLLASRLDVELLGDDAWGRSVVERMARALQAMAQAIDDAADRVRRRTPAAGPSPAPAAEALFADLALPPNDRRARLLPAVTGRVQVLAEALQPLQALPATADEPLPLSTAQLQRFVAPEGWPLAALRAQLSLGSPVLRHAVRMALALGCAYFIAFVLPWSSHPHWLVLSVAVVLRGNLEQTLTRRNARVRGTALGCLLVVLVGRFDALHPIVFLLSVGVAHSFVNVRYLATATAATVMALLQAHMAQGGGGFAIGERLADTVIGALLAWAFSYVLPAWERRDLPLALGRCMAALRHYAGLALQPPQGAGVEQRLARRQAYDLLGAMAAKLQRGAVEPAHVRVPEPPLAAFLDHGQRLMAHLSLLRLVLVRAAPELAADDTRQRVDQARTALMAALDLQAAPCEPVAAAPGLESLPEHPPAQGVLPWLLRRLDAATHEARSACNAARAAVAAVQR